VQQAIEKADTLIEALAWIRQFRDKTTVIKLGGSMLSDPEAIENILLDILFMESVGMRPVVVHGAGSRISAAMQTAGIEPRFVDGRRYTDQATLEIVEKVLAHNDDQGQPMDLGFVGEITKVDRLVIDNLCYAGQVPFIPSMAETEDGQKLNVNADTVATKVAQELNAHKLVILSDVPGVLRNPDDPESIISSLTRSEALALIQDGTISGGMIPKTARNLYQRRNRHLDFLRRRVSDRQNALAPRIDLKFFTRAY